MLKRATLCFISALMCALCGCSQDYYTSEPAFEYYTQCSKEVFATGITFQAAVRGGNEESAIKDMLALMDDINSEMSLSLSSSALSEFNALGSDFTGEGDYESPRVEISESAYSLICKCVEYYRDTAGAFNIAVYPLTKLWNVDTEGLNKYGMFGSENGPEPPDIGDVEALISHCNLDNLKSEVSDGKYYIYKTDPLLKIDLGAVAKGYAADECIRIARGYKVESAFINISGNICLLGEWYHPEHKKYVRWEVGITSPTPRGGFGGNMCALSVGADKTLVTSGDYVRYYQTESGGEPLIVPHIVSGITGLPLGVTYSDGAYKNSSDHIISATVICEDSAKADAYATAVCLMSSADAAEFLSSRGLHAVLVTQDGKMLLIGVTESSSSGEEYFVYKDSISRYADYRIEEYAVE